MSTPKFDELMDGVAVLKCPSCDGNDMHQGLVRVFNRDEDADSVDMTIVDDDVSTFHRIPSQGSGNPSSRRHGLTIEFYCEACDGQTFILGISQHKGWTHLKWVNDA
jgi:hypothetical protein